ncbi:excinuclease ABC subunit UvrB [Verrucomicrobiaceae bacterium R5-34]|uniref:UvrABC system protein B n=1 Tax=Oceaniferula flava TaxID=2800421 RepID=A0AAE2SBC4_9BACT|nr:excinuclease ABC subunit UvrB [Oceaniferula flavus]MBK1830150.1 excinuclease ABC subunit UvrB [Verrucomicrobiaceae bacterium R5-34]MBK1854738.1 excinuclease ABC subunit UvrB [Oceaniferula flavus]MBM1136044.1 excinuclease ABC subunit UvrB [Oceaniferula flavus]
MPFSLNSDYSPSGDQGPAIEKLVKSIEAGNRHQTLLGVTGSGKTFTAANIIERTGKPTLVMSHNKTLAAQLYSELKNFFPNNAVEYFVSYFDYYQPEAYIPRSDTYIEKDSSINDEIERLRLSTMGSLITREDVIVVASVSCIYGLGSPEDYQNMMLPVKTGDEMDREEFLAGLVNLMFERNDIAFSRGQFRVRGDVVEVHPAYLEETAIRVEFFGDEIERISQIDALTGSRMDTLDSHTFFPAKQFVTDKDKLNTAIRAIKKEATERVEWFEKHDKLIEAQRIRMRTDYDIEMMQEMGFCQGIENYSRHLTGREPGARPYTLLDFFPDDYLLLMDESHVSVPQVGGMYEGDKNRKTTLVEHGFRLPSALDNRPLKFDEFMQMTNQRVYISATPGPFEFINSRPDNKRFIPWKRGELSAAQALKQIRKTITPSGADQDVDDFDVRSARTNLVVEQIIRPTGLLDPILTLKPLKGQIDTTIDMCRDRVEKGERVLVTTLTKKTAEDLSEYIQETGLKVRYIHADVGAVERVEILRSLRNAEIDVLVGINLLREGLDLPEVSLVCILDADKEGFLRNETSLIQTAGRAARHVSGECVLFCDEVTDSIQALINITEYRRAKQIEYNEQHGITPQSVIRGVQKSLSQATVYAESADEVNRAVLNEDEASYNVTQVIAELEEEMREAAAKLEFERAAHLRDQIKQLQKG